MTDQVKVTPFEFYSPPQPGEEIATTTLTYAPALFGYYSGAFYGTAGYPIINRFGTK